MALSQAAIDLIEARGLDVELAVRLGLDSSPRSGGGEVLVFPYVVKGEVVNHKYRSPDKRFHQDAGAVKCFWNFDAIADLSLADEPLIITEGEFDAMAAIQCGFVRAVSVPDGAPKEEIADSETRKYSYLDHAGAALRSVKTIILATDSDGPGQALLNDLSIRLGKARCKWVRYPKGCKDLNDALREYGPKGVSAVFDRAEWCKVDGVYRMSELPPYPVRKQHCTGMPGMDRHYRIRMGDFCVVTGIPGHGKSTFVNDMLCRAVERYGWRVAIASFEQHPQADHRRALREWFCRCPIADEHGQPIALDEDIARADAWIDEHFVFIVPDDDDLANLSWVLEKCASAVIRYGCRVVTIDPWNELDHDRPSDISLTEYTGKAIKEFKRLARSVDCHVIVVAHPTKLAGGERPGLYSISDSAHWANKPDVGVVVWKPNMEGQIAEIKVVKSRYHDQIGYPGKLTMRYNPFNRRFDLAPESEADDR